MVGVWVVYRVTAVKFVKIVKILEMVWACGWDEGVFTPSENFENGENGLDLWLECGFVPP